MLLINRADDSMNNIQPGLAGLVVNADDGDKKELPN
jgi:hypothetical protein